MEHTKGKFRFEGHFNEHMNYEGKKNGVYYGFVSSDANVWKEVELHSKSKVELQANAELIADAFNTTNESGLTPSQLYKQNQELLEFLIDLRNGDYVYINNATFEKADELINNAKKK